MEIHGQAFGKLNGLSPVNRFDPENQFDPDIPGPSRLAPLRGRGEGDPLAIR